MRCLILGGTGAMGVPLVDKLISDLNNEVYVTSRSVRQDIYIDGKLRVKYFCGDAHDMNFLTSILNEYLFDVIVDFMTYSVENFKNNMNFLLKNTQKYIFLSSSRVYADSKELITENSPRILDICKDKDYLATDDYPLIKAREENLLFESKYHNWIILRPYLTYNTYRLQLGVYEKEQWLKRAIAGRTILFPEDMAEKYTTLTHANDVISCLIYIINNSDLFSDIYQVTTKQALKWKQIIEIYFSAIQRHTGIYPQIVYIDKYDALYKLWPEPLFTYDRLLDRKFDNSKIINEVNQHMSFLDIEEGLNKCIDAFLFKPQWYGTFTKYEAWVDSVTHELSELTLFPGKRNKIIYLLNRFL